MRTASSYATKPPTVLQPAMFSVKYTRARIALVFALVALCLLWNLAGIGSTGYIRRPAGQPVPQLPGYDLPGNNETLVISRTGSTELENGLTIHLTTSLWLFPNHLIFSDFEEEYHGEQILDALADVNVDILESNSDFELYRRLRKGGRAALDPSELAGSPDKYASKSGNVENPGWKLDKWKFLPMVNRTLHECPNMKWYVFIEADSFLFGSLLQQYLATLDATKPIDAGKQMLIANDLFAHGGSGFVVSQPALRTVVDYYTSHKASIEEWTNNHWAGDCVLGKTFTDSGVHFTNAWPSFQGEHPGLVQYMRADARAEGKTSRLWCGTPVSYHHMTPGMTQDMWDFEQDWIAKHDPVTDTLRHGDVFTDLLMPQMMAPHAGWENLSEHEEGTFASVDECRALCVAQVECRQYSFDQDGVCRTNVEPRLGRAGQGVTSGWIEDRIIEFQRGMEPCPNGSWPF